ncbi:hypothetical protein [Acidithiobacillus caldus]|jgi:hypothetical protein|uniref:Uncharacterized protein n=1 Tax=Acidithiobacillus caldus TaxID=33059 RepID=A0A1E7YKX9_9PROT|nr:hypothetical protein [Acidithiobacillus caldus]OFC30736.1 hypothetical protein BAE27_11200 [Acidithiobacillus caldus]OFC37340.1 hypothetical protein BAE28_07215 [Acidithiobacillus caldus]OFC38798.1 hypothetical protein BAE29_08425 [Acidithiobacillus caldus]
MLALPPPPILFLGLLTFLAAEGFAQGSYCLDHHIRHPTMLILGDPITCGLLPYLLRAIPTAMVGGGVGWHFSGGVRTYRKLLAYPEVQAISTVVVELGTSNPVAPE